MSILPMPDPAAEREREAARQNPDQETLELAAQGAAKVLGADHGVTMAFAKAAESMAPAGPHSEGVENLPCDVLSSSKPREG